MIVISIALVMTLLFSVRPLIRFNALVFGKTDLLRNRMIVLGYSKKGLTETIVDKMFGNEARQATTQKANRSNSRKSLR